MKISNCMILVLILMVLVNCGSNQLTSEKAAEIIHSDIDKYVEDFLANHLKHDSLLEQNKQEVLNKMESVKKSITMKGVRVEAHSAIAKINVKIEDVNKEFELKFNYYDTNGWQLDEIRASNTRWHNIEAFKKSARRFINSVTLTRKIKSTMFAVKKLGEAIIDYSNDNFEVPQVDSLKDLESKLSPFYIRMFNEKDEWGNSLYYFHGTGKDNMKFSIGSAGSDGKFNGFDQSGSYTKYSGQDIIYSNGEFTFYPDLKSN